MLEFRFILPEEQQAYLDAGWIIVGPGKVHGAVWSVIARREVEQSGKHDALTTIGENERGREGT